VKSRGTRSVDGANWHGVWGIFIYNAIVHEYTEEYIEKKTYEQGIELRHT